MPKSLKSNAKTKADLFTEPKGRAAAKPAAPRASNAEAGYTAADIEVLEGLEPVRRSDRQLDGRGPGRPRDLHRGRIDGRRFSQRDRQRPRHSGRSASEIPE